MGARQNRWGTKRSVFVSRSKRRARSSQNSGPNPNNKDRNEKNPRNGFDLAPGTLPGIMPLVPKVLWVFSHHHDSARDILPRVVDKEFQKVRALGEDPYRSA